VVGRYTISMKPSYYAFLLPQLKIARELARSEKRLSGQHFGRVVLERLRIGSFNENEERWLQLALKRQKTQQELARKGV